MADDMYNGAKLLLQDIDTELENKRLSRRDRLMLRSQKYLLEQTVLMRQVRLEVDALKKHDVIGWAYDHPRGALLSILGLGAVNSMVNWSGIRKPIIQAIAKNLFGVDLPLDVIP